MWNDCIQHGKYLGDRCKACDIESGVAPRASQQSEVGSGDWLDVLTKNLRAEEAQHCQCRQGSPDTCPKCTDMETGEKYADQDVAD